MQNNCTARPTYVFIVWKEDASLPAMFNCLCSSTAVQINNCLKRTFVINVATMKITDDFRNKWKPSRAYHKIDTFRVVNKDEWYPKEDRGNVMKNALRYG